MILSRRTMLRAIAATLLGAGLAIQAAPAAAIIPAGHEFQAIWNDRERAYDLYLPGYDSPVGQVSIDPIRLGNVKSATVRHVWQSGHPEHPSSLG